MKKLFKLIVALTCVTLTALSLVACGLFDLLRADEIPMKSRSEVMAALGDNYKIVINFQMVEKEMVSGTSKTSTYNYSSELISCAEGSYYKVVDSEGAISTALYVKSGNKLYIGDGTSLNLAYSDELYNSVSGTLSGALSGASGFDLGSCSGTISGADSETFDISDFENCSNPQEFMANYEDMIATVLCPVEGMIGVDKGSVTIAGRSCKKYTLDVSFGGTGVGTEICIDAGTGAVLKVAVATSGIEDGDVSINYSVSAFAVGGQSISSLIPSSAD